MNLLLQGKSVDTMLNFTTLPFSAFLMKLLSTLALIGFFASSTALAQGLGSRIDNTQEPMNIEAAQLAYDDAKQVGTFTGNVVLTRGTLTLRAHRMVVSQDSEGFQFVTLYAGAGKPATFRERRGASPDSWVEGQASDRIEYNGKTEVVQLFSKGRVTLLEGTRVTDQVEGDFISYDSRTEFYTVKNATAGAARPDSGRIRVIIQPRNENGGE